MVEEDMVLRVKCCLGIKYPDLARMCMVCGFWGGCTGMERGGNGRAHGGSGLAAGGMEEVAVPAVADDVDCAGVVGGGVGDRAWRWQEEAAGGDWPGRGSGPRGVGDDWGAAGEAGPGAGRRGFAGLGGARGVAESGGEWYEVGWVVIQG